MCVLPPSPGVVLYLFISWQLSPEQSQGPSLNLMEIASGRK
jgi:hypothetical protein